MNVAFKCGIVMASLMLLAQGLFWAQKPPTAGTHDAEVVGDFEAKVKNYLDMRQKIAGDPPGSSSDPARILARRQELANKVRVARAGAKQGEIFTPPVAEYFRHQIAASLAGPHGKEILVSLQHSEPVKMELQINESYPQNVPLQSTPPTLLLNLPPLPDHLEYRILDRELVLRDADANLVVDYVPNALPEVAK
jgi:hypothetical protein